jgi:hypothetical protein
MLGMDILRDYFIGIEPQRQLITFSRASLGQGVHTLRIVEIYPTPVLMVSVDGIERKLHLMTGSGMSFLPPDQLSGYSSDGPQEMVIPGLSPFTASVFNVPIEFVGSPLSLKCAPLPENIRVELHQNFQDGILGAEIFQTLPIILAFPQRIVSILT